MRSGTVVLVLFLVLAVLVVGGCGNSTDVTETDEAPVLADPDATGRELTSEYMSILQDGDERALEEFLGDVFVVQRADGSTATRDEYLATPIEVSSFELGSDVLGEQDGDVLVVRWAVRAAEASDKGAMSDQEAPRLSTFVWRDGGWKLVAHANFNTADR
jgi:hypothetical protein